MKTLFIVGILFIPVIISSFVMNPTTKLHPDEGEVLCLDYNNYDLGVRYLSDKDTIYFPFTNCSHDSICITNISCNNAYNQTPYGVIGTIKVGQGFAPGERDSIGFYTRRNNRLQSGLYDNSWTIHFKGMETKQYINIFCEYAENEGKLVSEKVFVDTVERGQSVDFTAVIKNEGKDPVTIRKFHDQKYATIKHSSLPITIQPGREEALQFTLNTDRLNQNYQSHITMETNEAHDTRRLAIYYEGHLISYNEPSMEFDSLVMTANRCYGEGLIYEFNFQNTGSRPLLISSCKTSCGCLVATWPKEPIQPGERNVIKIRYDTHRIGPINKSCTIRTNAPQEYTILRVKGNVKRCEDK
jgi:hypothetical protein